MKACFSLSTHTAQRCMSYKQSLGHTYLYEGLFKPKDNLNWYRIFLKNKTHLLSSYTKNIIQLKNLYQGGKIICFISEKGCCYLFIFSYCPLPLLSLQAAVAAQCGVRPYAGQEFPFSTWALFLINRCENDDRYAKITFPRVHQGTRPYQKEHPRCGQRRFLVSINPPSPPYLIKLTAVPDQTAFPSSNLLSHPPPSGLCTF